MDSGATTHISIPMQGYLSYRTLNDVERFTNMNDENLMKVEIIGHFRLLLRIITYLGVKETSILPLFKPM